MRANIGAELLRSKRVRPADKKFEICDMKLKGFVLTIYPDVHEDGDVVPGGKVYGVRYRLNGKQTRKSIGRDPLFTPARARDEAEKILHQVKQGMDPAESRPAITYTLQTFLRKEYQPWAEVNHKASKATLGHFLRFQDLLDKPLDHITPYMVEAWRTARLKGGVRPSTTNRDLAALKSLFAKAVEWGKLSANPLYMVKPKKVDGGVVRFLSYDEKKRLMKALDDREERMRTERETANNWRIQRGYPPFPQLKGFADHLKPLVLISLNTGARWGELATLTWSSVDLEKGLLTIRGSNAKNSDTRHIPLNAVALETLKIWKEQTKGSGLVFPGRGGKLLVNVDRSWKKILAEADIKSFRWHDMRHTFASWLVMEGVDLNTVRELLGHKDIKMTLRYAHLAAEHKASAVGRLVRS